MNAPHVTEHAPHAHAATASGALQRLRRLRPELAEIDDPLWHATLAEAQPLHHPSRAVLFDELTAAIPYLLLTEGTLRVFKRAEDGREITLYRVYPGEICLVAMVASRASYPLHAVAESESEIRAMVLPNDTFESAMEASPRLRATVMKNMCEHIFTLISLVSDTVFNRMDMRLACLLGRLFERQGDETLKITHQALANEIGTSREVVSRTLKEFERQGCIELSRGKIHLKSAERLAGAGAAARD